MVQLRHAVLGFVLATQTFACKKPPPETENSPGFSRGVLVAASVGTAPGMFSLAPSDESEPRAPSSLCATDDGRVAVLDQENGRINLYQNSVLSGSVALKDSTADDLLALPGGGFVVIDRSKDLLLVIDAAGAELRREPLAGDGVSESGLVAASFRRPDGIWLAVKTQFVKVLGPAGETLPHRTIRTGLPSYDGKWLYTVRSLGDNSVEILRRTATGLAQYESLHVPFENPQQVLVGFDQDSLNNLYLFTETPSSGDGEALWSVQVITPDLQLDRTEELEPDHSPTQAFRQFSISAAGNIFQLDVSNQAVRVRSF